MSSLFKFMAVSLLSISHCYASASQVIAMDPHKRLEASISKDNLNRLSVMNDRITQVFGDEEAYVAQVDEHSGQIFLKPSDLNGSKPISLTLITENGKTQDLTLKPFDREASTLILKASTKEEATAETSAQGKFEPIAQSPLEKSLSVQERLINAMKMLVLGQLPAAEANDQKRECPEGFAITHKQSYQVGPFKGQKYELVNKAETLIEIEDKSFYRQGDLALSFQKRVLKPEESTHFWVIAR